MILLGDCRETLKQLPDGSVNCVVTSPPYWGLRDYGTATWEGGEAACDHKGMALASSSSSLAGYTSESVKIRTFTMPQGQTCRKCGAVRIDSQIGLESTPAEYVEKMVAVFREVRRVLRDDGTLWLNLGDSYAGSGKGRMGDGTHAESHGAKQGTNRGAIAGSIQKSTWDVKPKDLVGIPWRVAFALQADGWYLRSDIIWAKPNPMPESVRDRPTKSHEYLFLLAKSEKYYFDQDAVREPNLEASVDRYKDKTGFTIPEAWKRNEIPISGGKKDNWNLNAAGRNRRTVWTIATQPYKGSHFATFPEKLVRPCILAGCPIDGTVLDPFGGSGTVGKVAGDLGRQWILCELNPAYIDLAEKRTARSEAEAT